MELALQGLFASSLPLSAALVRLIHKSVGSTDLPHKGFLALLFTLLCDVIPLHAGVILARVLAGLLALPLSLRSVEVDVLMLPALQLNQT